MIGKLLGSVDLPSHLNLSTTSHAIPMIVMLMACCQAWRRLKRIVQTKVAERKAMKTAR